MNIALFTNSNIGISLYSFLIKKNINIKLVVCGNYSTLIQFKLRKVDCILYQKKNIDKIVNILKKKNIDLGAVACFTILPKKIWNLPKYKMINMHYSLLYSYAGPNPILWQIHNKEIYTGVTVHFISNKIDKGKIIIQEKTTIPKSMSVFMTYRKLKPIGQHCVLKAIKNIEKFNGKPPVLESKYPYSYYSFYYKKIR